MRFTRILLAIVLAVSLPMLASAEPPVITGSFTNGQTTITNTWYNWDVKYILLEGPFSGSAEVSMTLNNGDAPYILVSSTTVTNTLAWIDGIASADWMKRGTLKLSTSSSLTATNFYRIRVKEKD